MHQSRAQSSPAQRWVGRRGDLWGHEKNMFFLIGSQKNNRWAEAGRTARSYRKSSKKDIFPLAVAYKRKSTERKGGR